MQWLGADILLHGRTWFGNSSLLASTLVVNPSAHRHEFELFSVSEDQRAKELKIVTEQLLDYRTFTDRRNFHLHQSKHPNALLASWRLSSVNRRSARCLFHQRCARPELKQGCDCPSYVVKRLGGRAGTHQPVRIPKFWYACLAEPPGQICPPSRTRKPAVIK